MGYGDEIMGTGMAKGAAARGVKIAFGDKKQRRLHWTPRTAMIFRSNPNIARPSDSLRHVEWIAHYKGHRLYNHQTYNKWVWHYDFRVKPGEFYFSKQESDFAKIQTPGFILIEPNVPAWKSVSPNKDWGLKNYQAVADALREQGHFVCQFVNGPRQLERVHRIAAADFRYAAAVLTQAALFIGPEGGLHHAAAAVGTKAIVLFGGFIPPEVTGYDFHINLTGDSERACGSLHSCDHCKRAMQSITAQTVIEAAEKEMRHEAPAK